MTDWMDRAACLNIDPDIFFPERGESAKPAKRVCSQCPVVQQCLDYALTLPEDRLGVFGGTTPRERSRIRTLAGGVSNSVAVYECGTAAAYWRHRRRDEEPCGSCRDAHREYRRRGTGQRRDRGRAA